MKSRRGALVMVPVGVCAVAVAWMFLGDPAGEGLVGNANVVGGVAGAAALALAVLAWWPRPAQDPAADRLDQAAAYLAAETLSYWQRQAKDRRITTPLPATVRWRWAAPTVAAPAEQIHATTTDRDPELLTAGMVTQLRQQLYLDLPDHGSRIVILGGAGAGKTTAMLLLLVDVLRNRTAQDHEPVPVWLTLGGWTPNVPLLDWAATVLARDFPGLVADKHGGPAVPAELIRTGRVALFLDGLDEMPFADRGPALHTIDRATTGLRVVLTSRPEEFRAAIEEHRLWDAAVIDVLPVDVDNACDFLLHQQTEPRRRSWEEVTTHLRRHPDSVAARTLTSPLALSLARDTYTHTTAAPTELLAFATPDALLRHLLTRLLTLAYPDPAEHAYALRWLTWIATHLDGRPDIRWWDFPLWMAGPQARLQRLSSVVVGPAAGLTVGLSTTTVLGLLTVFTDAVRLSPGAVQAIGLTTTIVVGLIAALVAGSGAGVEPQAFTLRLPRPAELRATTRGGLTLGLVGQLLRGLIRGLRAGLLDGLLLGLGLGFLALIPAILSGLAFWQQDEAGAVAGGLAAAIAIGLGVTAPLCLMFGLLAGNGPARDLTVMELVWTLRGNRIHFITVLETALRKEVLRQTGAVYQFRHAALQDLLTPGDAERRTSLRPGR